jgi:phosphoglycolate phosphatase-like HAD superfamily hydrolase
VLSGGAGARAMARAFEDEFGIADALKSFSVSGRTDAWIVAHAASVHGVASSPDRLQRLRSQYFDHLAREIRQPAPRKQLLPGVKLLLDALSIRDDVFLALLTGNFEGGARIKLEYFDLWQHFRCGAFGDVNPDRNALLDEAFERVKACGAAIPDPSRIVVVGDTPFDVEVARSGGVRSVAVATGGFDAPALRAAGADVVLDDFSDIPATLAALGC